jgi:hypothetical protein
MKIKGRSHADLIEVNRYSGGSKSTVYGTYIRNVYAMTFIALSQPNSPLLKENGSRTECDTKDINDM